MPPAALRAIALSTVLVVALAGCSAIGDEPTREDRAVEALEDTRDALEDVETYRYEADLAVAADRRSIDGSLFGAVDLADRRLYTNATTDGETLESYVDGRTMKEQCPSPWGGWHVEELEDEAFWPAETPTHAQLALFDTGDLYWNGTETVDGREAVRLSGSPSADALDDGATGGGSPFDFGGPNVDETSATLWIDAETDRPLESHVEFTVTDGDESATASITMRYLDYDDAVSIDVPTIPSGDQYELGCPGA